VGFHEVGDKASPISHHLIIYFMTLPYHVLVNTSNRIAFFNFELLI